MTRTALEKLTEKQKVHLTVLKQEYSKGYRKDETLAMIGGYLSGLRDAGTITETDKRCLFCFYTL